MTNNNNLNKSRAWWKKFDMYTHVRNFDRDNPNATLNDYISRLNQELNQ